MKTESEEVIKTEPNRRKQSNEELEFVKESDEGSFVFENRKKDHIRLSLDPATEASELQDLDRIQLNPMALPELNLADIDSRTDFFGYQSPVPFFISSMTAGHRGANSINLELARLAHETGIVLAVGSQRRQLFDSSADSEWLEIVEKFPRARLMGNIGISQLITHGPDQILRVMESLGKPLGLFIHTNPLQEALQPEGTPQFAGGVDALRKLCKLSPFPIVLKEVGCGLTYETLMMLAESGLSAVDLSGVGGTHWGRIEGLRSPERSIERQIAEVFYSWGQSSVQTLLEIENIQFPFEIWASGGVRNGLEICKLLALGAQKIGLARPFLQAAILDAAADTGKIHLNQLVEKLQRELEIAMFCSGVREVKRFRIEKKWKLKRT